MESRGTSGGHSWTDLTLMVGGLVLLIPLFMKLYQSIREAFGESIP